MKRNAVPHNQDRGDLQKPRANLYWKKDPLWYLWFQENEDEIFKKIPGYTGFYFISNYGRVVSFRRTEPRELVPEFNGRPPVVNLLRGKRKKVRKIHDLVYLCFRGPIPKDKVVENIDGDPDNNHYENLRLRKRKPARAKGSKQGGRKTKTVVQFSLKGEFIKEYPSLHQAARETKLLVTNISNCACKRARTCGGFQWLFRNDPMFKEGIRDVPRIHAYVREILQFSMEGKYIRSFPSIAHVEREAQIPHTSIHANLKGERPEVNGYQFRYRSDPLFDEGIVDIPATRPLPHKQAAVTLQFSLDGRFTAEFPSAAQAARATNIPHSNITACLRGLITFASGYRWLRRDDPRFANGIVDIEPMPVPMRGEIMQFDLNGNFLRKYPDANAAAAAAGVTPSAIRACARKKEWKCAEYRWRYACDPNFADGLTDIPTRIRAPHPNAQAVLKFNPDGEIEREFHSIKAAADAHGVSQSTLTRYIENRIRTSSGNYWELKKNLSPRL